MQKTITIKGKEYTVLLGYAVLKLINQIATEKKGQEDLNFEDFEKITLKGIESGCKQLGQEFDLKLQDIQEAFEENLDTAMEVQVLVEGFMITHSERLKMMRDQANKK